MPSTSRRQLSLRIALVAAAVLLVGVSPPAAGARSFHTVLQDDELSLFSPAWLPQFMAKLRWLGVDYVRISAEWKLEAPDPNSRQIPRGFNFASPASYSSAGMQIVDRAVRAAARAGIGVIIDPAFSAPLWATSSKPGSQSYRDNINIPLLVQWESMLALRYNGFYTPPGARAALPRVQIFTLWNEPNGRTFLQPQWRGGVPASADWTRQLAEAAYPAIKRGNPDATVLIGNTSDAGSDVPAGGQSVAPMTFIRRMACVDAALVPVTQGACAHFRMVPADGFAHHPYERDDPPWVQSGSDKAGWAQMGDLPKLQLLLDQLVAMHRLAPGAANLWLTEQGYETNAELGNRPWTEPRQAQMNAASEYLAWRNPQIQSFSQFLLRDTLTYETLALRASTGHPAAQRLGTWTTGLMREDMAPKPSLAMFRAPIVLRVLASAGSSSLYEVWGRARPLRASAPIRIQLATGGAFRPVGNAVSDDDGIFDTELVAPAHASLRFEWLSPTTGTWQASPATTALPIPGAS
jgi:hypothetical protein